MFDFVTSAYAQGGGAPPAAPNPLGSLIMLGVMILIFYLLLIRPQQKRLKEHQRMIAALQRGDEVVTQGGLRGRIHALTERVVTLEAGWVAEKEGKRGGNVAKRPIYVQVDREAIARRIGGGEGEQQGNGGR